MRPYNPLAARHQGLGYSRFARHYSGNHYCFLFLCLLRCFSSAGWLPPYGGQYIFNVLGCPIRKSSDIMLVCSSPKLIAAYHVLHRLSDPRHSPYALNCFKNLKCILCAFLHSIKLLLLVTTYFIPNMSKNFFSMGKNANVQMCK
jgi:hypothetical protein